MSNIQHIGKVVSIHTDTVKVQVEQTEACSQCDAKSACLVQKRQLVVDAALPSFPIEEGMLVNVLCHKTYAFRALGLAYVLPTLLVLSTLIVCILFDIADTWAAIVSLGVLSAYACVAWSLLNKRKNIVFFIKKL